MIPVNDSRLRWLGPIGLFLFGNIFFRLAFWLQASPIALIHSTVVGLGAGCLFWQLNRAIFRYFQQQHPGLERTVRRLRMVLLLIPLLVNGAVFFRFGLHVLLGSRPTLWLDWVDYVTSLGIQLFYQVVYISIYEGGYLLSQWKRTYQEKEELIKIQWQTRFNSLKGQVNSHFLFNSLNALSALIEESPAQASQFVDELSKMYRYLLQANDQELVSLRTELAFIDSYTHLLQTRHGSGVTVQTTVPEDYLASLLPPLTLQLLVENAVKHNVVLANRPLLIEIGTTKSGQLQVRNNLQRKHIRALSNGVGLANIMAKYRMLTPREIIVQTEGDHFTVLLPLLK
ncbi:sensor histidine kinase [Spirosoma foliorum]|uniref:Histidine kinase n=1 Tax=Spirosoma foliorum TaxID=2710596 RepID=A0A7G5H199_9BACT|nr:sensor histidine kinase [Spirosoma foliorum]QMW04891.1 histidine kinase [Spirosoma foliorum]